jgi:hypothetical protein
VRVAANPGKKAAQLPLFPLRLPIRCTHLPHTPCNAWRAAATHPIARPKPRTRMNLCVARATSWVCADTPVWHIAALITRAGDANLLKPPYRHFKASGRQVARWVPEKKNQNRLGNFGPFFALSFRGPHSGGLCGPGSATGSQPGDGPAPVSSRTSSHSIHGVTITGPIPG